MRDFRPLRARYKKIEALCENVLREARIDAPSVPVLKIVKKLGIAIKEADLGKDISGMLIRSDGQILIGVNSSHAETRRRFTIAHEFGHYLLHGGITAHIDKSFIPRFRSPESSQATNVEEIEANFFAASLLMPRAFLAADAGMDSMDDDDEVAALAKRYQVSRHAMSLRLANLFGDHRPF